VGWLTGWDYRKPVTLSRADGATWNNWQYKITIEQIADKMNVNLSDVRFTDIDGTTLLQFVVLDPPSFEGQEGTGQVCVASLAWPPAEQYKTIYMYYGNSGADFQELCEAGAYTLCDTFGTGTVDPTKWVITDGVTESGGNLQLSNPLPLTLRKLICQSILTFDPGSELTAKVTWPVHIPKSSGRKSAIGFFASTDPFGSGAAISLEHFYSPDTWRLRVYSGSTTETLPVTGIGFDAPFICSMKWNHDGTVQLYIDGVLKVTSTVAVTDTGLYCNVGNNDTAPILQTEWIDLVDYLGVLEFDGEGNGDDGGGTEEVQLTVDFSADKVQATVGQNINFTDDSASLGAAVDTWAWTFGDTQTSTEQNPTHSYDSSGLYDVALTASIGGDPEDTETKVGYIEIVDPTDTGVGSMIDDIAFRVGEETLRGAR